MIKKLMSVTLLLIFAISCVGCSGVLRKKFVRKKKDEVKHGPVLQPYDYAKEFTNRQSYANHFAFWKNSESEVIASLKSKKSQKRIVTYATYSFSEIKKLHELLIEEKQKELMPYVKEMEGFLSNIKTPNYVNSQRRMLIKNLKKHYYSVERQFKYFTMQRYVKPDEEEEREGVKE